MNIFKSIRTVSLWSIQRHLALTLLVLTSTSTQAQFGDGELLIVAKEGMGTITSRPSGIFCGTGCEIDQEIFDFGDLVEIRARPATGWRLVRWNGACSGNNDCNVIMNTSRTVTATFEQNGDSNPPDDPPLNDPEPSPVQAVPPVIDLILTE